jgi:hypothetical protein
MEGKEVEPEGPAVSQVGYAEPEMRVARRGSTALTP